MKEINFNKIIPLLKNSGVKSAGVFGSYVNGEKIPNDIDILVELEQPLGFFKFLHLEDKLSQELNLPVDLVTKNSLSPYLREGILNQTKMFYEKR